MSYDVSFEDVLAGEKESLYEALYAPVGESIEDEDLDSLYDAFDEQMEEPDSGAETSEEATPEVAEPSEPSLTPQEQRLYNAAAAAQPQGPQPTPKE